jgi:hypothetical protein
MTLRDKLVLRAQEFAQGRGLSLGNQLGHGVHGIVFATESQPEKGVPAVQSAVKVHEREAAYCQERDVYLRLKENAVTAIQGCHVPQILSYDDQSWIIEMTVVSPPFVLDFAGAFLDRAPGFSEEVLADWRAEKQDQFGTRWPEVETILRALQANGIYLVDVSPSNVSLGS